MVVIRDDLLNGLTKLGVHKNHNIIVHSSLSSFGVLDGGALTLIEVLQDIVTDSGLITMPVFTYGKEPFDRCKTPSKTGQVTEVFRTASRVFRSEHPTHSICSWGNCAEDVVSGHKTESAFGIGSPLCCLCRESDVLLVGVSYVAASMIHVGQELASVGYIDRPKEVRISSDDGTISLFKVRRAGCSLGFDNIKYYIDVNQTKSIVVGNSFLSLVPSLLIVEATIKMLCEDPKSLFCKNPGCFSCNEARKMLGI